ncbi:MAG: cytochrome b N-terminal domain-containing protein [Candidatus Bathyarchaeia archaeon]
MISPTAILRKLWNWFVSRTKIEPILRATVAKGALSPMYCLGGLTFLFFFLLAITGMMLGMYYKPSPDAAYSSLQDISTNVRYGWLIRGVHFYAANGMIITSILHMLRVYFTGAYKKPRELNWMVGVGLGAFTIMAGFTGYVLRWDQEAVGAAGIGLGLAGAVPLFGTMMTSLVWGTNYDDTVGRFFAFHVWLIPGLLMVLMLLHFWMVKRHHIAQPL